MKRRPVSRRKLRAWTCGLVGACLVPAPAEAAERAQPNVVIILADDLGWGSLNSYGASRALVNTARIDRLAREGRRFIDASAPSSVCTPTRYSLLTGRYAWRTSLQTETLKYWDPLLIDVGRLTIASMLKRQSYLTAAIGKWHLGYGSQPRLDYTGELKPGPLEIGFDYHFGIPATHGDVTGVYIENHRVAGLRPGPRKAPVPRNFYFGREYLGLNAPDRREDEVMKVLTDKAVTWLEQQEVGRPFFLYFAPVAVHFPITPSAERRGTSKAGLYGDWIHELDASVGRLLDALDRRKLAQSTLVIFTSDNGAVIKPDGPEGDAIKAGLALNGRWRGRKHKVFEGGFRVPLLARWPGRIPAGSVCGDMVSLVDLTATIAAIVGEKLPPAARAAEDSYNVLPALLGERPARPVRDAMVLHSADGVFAVRQGPWKWIEGRRHPSARQSEGREAQHREQLYNLRDDPEEKADLLSRHPEQARRLAELLKKYREQGYSRP